MSRTRLGVTAQMRRRITRYDLQNNAILSKSHPVTIQFRCDKCQQYMETYKALTLHKREAHAY